MCAPHPPSCQLQPTSTTSDPVLDLTDGTDCWIQATAGTQLSGHWYKRACQVDVKPTPVNVSSAPKSLWVQNAGSC